MIIRSNFFYTFHWIESFFNDIVKTAIYSSVTLLEIGNNKAE